MKNHLDIRLYQHADNEAALALEAQCPQGKSLKLSFHRRSFHLRSELYENAQLWVAFMNDRLIATIAGAVKEVQLNGHTARAGYIYDIRVHPQSHPQLLVFSGTLRQRSQKNRGCSSSREHHAFLCLRPH